MVKLIWDTRNANDVSMHVKFIHSWIEDFKNIQRKKWIYKIYNKKAKTDLIRYFRITYPNRC